MIKIILIGSGGFLGAISRFICSKLINKIFPLLFIPLGTILVNCIGAFILSFLLTYQINRFNLSKHVIMFLGTGFLGSFTTFSTFTYETLNLFEKAPVKGVSYLFIMLLSGFLTGYLGYILGRSL